MILKEKLEEVLFTIKIKMLKDGKKPSEALKFKDLNYIKKAIDT